MLGYQLGLLALPTTFDGQALTLNYDSAPSGHANAMILFA